MPSGPMMSPPPRGAACCASLAVSGVIAAGEGVGRGTEESADDSERRRDRDAALRAALAAHEDERAQLVAAHRSELQRMELGSCCGG